MKGRPMDDSTGERTQTLVILGAHGDLTTRLLLPGLGSLIALSSLDALFLVGSNRGEGSDEEWRATVARAFADADASGPAVDAVVRDTRYVAADATDEGDLRRLLDLRRDLSRGSGLRRQMGPRDAEPALRRGGRGPSTAVEHVAGSPDQRPRIGSLGLRPRPSFHTSIVRYRGRRHCDHGEKLYDYTLFPSW